METYGETYGETRQNRWQRCGKEKSMSKVH
jgi:hypothetical protein